jgi:very-short-patch-repair endonuclease
MSNDRADPRTSRARALRREATPAERRLWAQLKQIDISGSHFRRQAPIGPYFADFACHRTRLVVEVDGEQHGFDAGRRHDSVRTRFLEAQGYRVLRFWNAEVVDNLDGVVETICAALREIGDSRGAPPPLTPPRHFVGGGGCSSRTI